MFITRRIDPRQELANELAARLRAKGKAHLLLAKYQPK